MEENREITRAAAVVDMGLPVLTRIALHLNALDNSWTLAFSDATRQFYVMASIEVGGDGLLSSVTEHRDDPAEAICAFFDRIADVCSPAYLVTGSYTSSRRHWRWNGAAFVEVDRG